VGQFVKLFEEAFVPALALLFRPRVIGRRSGGGGGLLIGHFGI
jgi:hypothetical protein